MAKLGDDTIRGASGTHYTFDLYHYPGKLRDCAAVYIITERSPTSDHNTASNFHIYVGETEDLSALHSGHHKAACFKKFGANAIGILLDKNEANRRAIKSDILGTGIWPCND
ncbi:MAG: hypothetical protein ACPGIC_07835 [Opitutales bacterium]